MIKCRCKKRNELVISGKKELPPPKQKFSDESLVQVQIAYGESALGKMARKMGGKWDPDVKLWHIPYGKIKGTELEKNMIVDAKEKLKP